MKSLSKRIIWNISLCVVLLLAFGIANYYFKMQYAFIILIIPFALVVNGIIVEWEDDAPGGFNNPNGDDLDANNRHSKRLRIFYGVMILLFAVTTIFVSSVLLLMNNRS
jgi:amino acid permease